jgi:hypothetical protein
LFINANSAILYLGEGLSYQTRNLLGALYGTMVSSYLAWIGLPQTTCRVQTIGVVTPSPACERALRTVVNVLVGDGHNIKEL